MADGDRKGRVVAAATDGACSGNPGPGGWGALIRFEDGSTIRIGYDGKNGYPYRSIGKHLRDSHNFTAEQLRLKAVKDLGYPLCNRYLCDYLLLHAWRGIL